MFKHTHLERHYTNRSDHTPQFHLLDSTMVYKRRRLLCSTTTDDVRVYQAPPGDGRSKQLAPSGDDVTPYKWPKSDVTSGDCVEGHSHSHSHSHGQGQGQMT